MFLSFCPPGGFAKMGWTRPKQEIFIDDPGYPETAGKWLMWTSFADLKIPVLYLAPWDEEIAQKEGTLHVCGELCAQKLQSQFMGNVRENLVRRGG
jgi:hypothetical protein